MATGPNILFLFTDQQNSGMMSCAGNAYLKTPAMDSLASGGVRFERAYCTNPVCMPSRFSLMTGRMPGEIGMISNRVSDLEAVPGHIKKTGLGFLMRDAGYDAVYAGKVHLPGMTPEDLGFSYICRDERETLADTCAEFIESGNGGKPFCLAVSFIDPHDICYMAIRDSLSTESERRLIEGGKVECMTLDEALKRPAGVGEEEFFARHCPPLPANFEPLADEPEAIRILLEQRPFRMKARKEWDARRWREHRWAYARLTERVDSQIYEVLEALEKSGQWDNTVIVFTSDHGDMDSAHRMEHKSTLYEEACRVPLVICAPDCNSPGRTEEEIPVSNGLDILPTLCDYAGAAPPGDISGISLRPLVSGKKIVCRRPGVPVESAVGRAAVTKKYKFAVYDLGESTERITDLEADPMETGTVNHQCPEAETENLREIFKGFFGNARRDAGEVFRAASDG